ncbi:hypothetical protein LHFGNBLO_004394 [Mesorhizobium sp. AR10]|uniref:hypothetical protein n=1 Tax=Mesorhizobium sp. AR10 TaxID=2865839 RepID=UPI00215F8E28|nr:hypothetical protein [Mesorhizobium sp. AR10]UVK37374.1 hypothetical protein LHFGNBLO_004394 [Mesorhizobium sp. AR10]
MRHLTIWAIALVFAAIALIASPLPVFQKQRNALAHWLIAEGFAVIGAKVYLAVASSGDATAKNNLGVLHYRGVGVSTDLEAARGLFTQAAALRSSQAVANLALVQGGGCGLDSARSATTVRKLETAVADGNAAAAKQTMDCLYFSAAKNRLKDPDGAMIAASLAIAGDDGPGRFKSGKALVNAARSIQHPGYRGSPTQQEYDNRVVRLIDRASIDLFAATELGQPQAYEWLGVARHQFQKLLPRLQLGERLGKKTFEEWMQAGAVNGDWAMLCRTASFALEDLLHRVGRYSRFEFDTAVARARECVERKQDGAASSEWYDAVEYPAVKPHPVASSYPTFDIGRAADALRRLLFQDAVARLKDPTS